MSSQISLSAADFTYETREARRAWAEVEGVSISVEWGRAYPAGEPARSIKIKYYPPEWDEEVLRRREQVQLVSTEQSAWTWQFRCAGVPAEFLVRVDPQEFNARREAARLAEKLAQIHLKRAGPGAARRIALAMTEANYRPGGPGALKAAAHFRLLAAQ